VQGELLRPHRTLRAVCYCRDCQAYAHALDDAARVLDGNRGTEVAATVARDVRFTAGADKLACLSLSERGLLRWYAACCRTPIANTPRDPRLPYAGVMHTCLGDAVQREQAFGPVRMFVNTKGAHPAVPRPSAVQMLSLLRIAPALLWARLSGGWRETPFFDAALDRPVTEPHVLSAQERAQAMAAVGRSQR
jgi:hypothetical protein